MINKYYMPGRAKDEQIFGQKKKWKFKKKSTTSNKLGSRGQKVWRVASKEFI